MAKLKRNSNPPPTADPRRLTLFVLNRMETENQILDLVLHDSEARLAKLSKRDRNLFHALVFGVLRWRGRLDWVIGYFSKTPLRQIDYSILNILRIGAYQIMYLSRIPDSAAVNTCVEMAKLEAPHWVAGFVNGLLRTISREYAIMPLPDPDRKPITAMAVAKSFPEWLIRRWRDRFGFEDTAMRCDGLNTIPPITIRTNTLRISRKQLLERLGSHAESIRKTSISPDGITLENPTSPISFMKPFREGLFQVQDEAAQLVSLFLDPQPNESILDACAGLGGKTGHLAQLMRNQGTLLATDRAERKLKLLRLEMDRMGVAIVKTHTHDFRKPLGENHDCPGFHRVLVDAPCSGLGVLRRNPDAKWSVTENHIERNRKQQIQLLNAVSSLVLPSGVLVYAVCSTEPEETESVIHTFIDHHADFTVDKDLSGLSDQMRTLVNQDGCLITTPHCHHMDGFFSVRLKKHR